MREVSRPVVVVAAVVVAVVVNLVVYGVGRVAGGSFRFTAAGGPAEVDAVTVAGFSAVPLLAGLTVVAVLAPWAVWVVRVALVAGPVLAVVTVPLMTVAADFDTVSTVALAVCHLVLVAVVVPAVRAIGRRVVRVSGSAGASVGGGSAG